MAMAIPRPPATMSSTTASSSSNRKPPFSSSATISIKSHRSPGVSRRDLLSAGLSFVPLLTIPTKPKEVEVGSYLPSFLVYKAKPTIHTASVDFRKCTAIHIYSSSYMETSSYGKHILWELLPTKVCRVQMKSSKHPFRSVVI
ncbi:unnamed protein product [Cuscuta epithymum]|uniref:Uncharacterized protein n=1 Tax=Cuscuta epithymum TaxID=186058 RepID=A0AAV0C8V1_9ASTE|nr:unnamed protein product [Cuscuta epithymum]